MERLAKFVDGSGCIAGQAPVTGKVVVEQRFLGVSAACLFQGLDSLRQPVRAFETPAQANGDSHVPRTERESLLQRGNSFSIQAGRTQRLAREKAGLELHDSPVFLGSQNHQGVLRQVEQ